MNVWIRPSIPLLLSLQVNPILPTKWIKIKENPALIRIRTKLCLSPLIGWPKGTTYMQQRIWCFCCYCKLVQHNVQSWHSCSDIPTNAWYSHQRVPLPWLTSWTVKIPHLIMISFDMCAWISPIRDESSQLFTLSWRPNTPRLSVWHSCNTTDCTKFACHVSNTSEPWWILRN